VTGPHWPAAVLSRSRVTTWLPRRGPLIVMYHGIEGRDGMTVKAFEQQVVALTKRRRVVSLLDAVQSLGRPESADVAAITFDDGYRDCVEFAVPILNARGLPATLFVSAGWLGKSNAWDPMRPQREILTARELRALAPERLTIGAHGLTHTRLSRMSSRQLYEETRVAKKILEDACGRAVTLFAYPYGQGDDFDDAAERAVAEAGFVAACSTKFGRGSRPVERFRLRRVGFESGDSIDIVERRLDGAYDWVSSKEMLGVFSRETLRRGARIWTIRS
jgi:peptidoglycan/xylan/chitin deacetylase (PgdA/CDA1 family)